MTGTKQIFVSGLLAFGLAVPAAAPAQTVDSEPTAEPSAEAAETTQEAPSEASPDLRKKVDALLGGVESSPTARQWKALGDDAVIVLVEVANDRSLPVVRRGRAVTALAHFASEDAREATHALVTDENTPSHVLRKAVRTLARLKGEAALPALEPHLSAESARLREATIDAIGEIRTAAAKALLRDQFARESKDYLKKKIGDHLSKPSRGSGSLQPLADVPVDADAVEESEQ